MKLEERKEKASAVRAKGYNCAQTLLAAFPDILQLPKSVSLKLGTGLGGGFGLTGNLCGVVAAMALLEGMRTQGAPSDKVQTYKNVNELHSRFLSKHGEVLCPRLKAKGIPCNDLISSGIEIYNDFLQGK